MRIAIVSDPMSHYGVAERAIEQILRLFPDADLFCVLDAVPEPQRGFLGGRPVNGSFLQGIPGSRRLMAKLLPLWPVAAEALELGPYDLVISSHTAVAHGVITGPDQRHVVYTHMPMRCLWDLRQQWLRDARLLSGLRGVLAQRMLHRLRQWEVLAAQRPSGFVAGSAFAARRVEKYYNRRCRVVHPPVDTNAVPYAEHKEDFYLTAAHLTLDKQVALILGAFRLMPDRTLVVVGDGPELERLRRDAPPNVYMVGAIPGDLYRTLLGRARAVVTAGIQGFSVLSVEAQAAGTPVIGPAQGGLPETVRPLGAAAPTGVLFERLSLASIVDAVETFERVRTQIRPADCRSSAERFSQAMFRHRFSNAMVTLDGDWQSAAAAE